jgi:hypothetical protein
MPNLLDAAILTGACVLSPMFVEELGAKNADSSLTIPKLKNVWGPVPHPSDEDLSLGTPVRSE